MGGKAALLDFLRWTALGLGAVLALIAVVGFGIPRRILVGPRRRRLRDVEPR